jgi:hypothetical protein
MVRAKCSGPRVQSGGGPTHSRGLRLPGPVHAQRRRAQALCRLAAAPGVCLG